MSASEASDLSDIRAGVRALCDSFGNEYWRGLEPDTYPKELVEALTSHGWLAALIPERYGGAGLGLTAGSAILEELNASGGNAAACHAQMYMMSVILRHGSEEQRERYLPEIAAGRLRLQGVRRHRADCGLGHDPDRHARAPHGRRLRRQRAEDLDLPRGALGPDAAAGAHDPAGGGGEA